ncbi:MAG TPA: DUF5818 domain-containing protein [Terracidiphilus sp.]|nr:DUF5818 domain-containing protein [Terracidiphilus sp.]
MNRISRLFVSCLTVGAAAGALTLASAAQPISGTAYPMHVMQSPQQPQMPQQQMPESQAARTSTFTGTIVKSGDTYALQTSGGTVYRLDDSSQAKQFAGKEVKVIGQLNPQTRVIHVSSIQGGS